MNKMAMGQNAPMSVTRHTNPASANTKVRMTAAYIRLSRETEGSLQRDTIGSQVQLVESFIAKQDDLELYETYIDDAVSGTTFSRPGFDRMLADMRSGNIQAIVVKDMSRLGRDYLEAGSLVERVFPLYGIRFISITDGFDTDSDADWLLMALTNLANTMYARDISQKINAARKGMLEKGIPVGKVPYGYRINHKVKDAGCMEIDEEAAQVVRRIFDNFIAGQGTTVISRCLNAEGVPSPLAYRYIRRCNPVAAAKYKWTANSVQQILGNETYTGRYVMGTVSMKIFQPKKRMYIPKEQWRIFENHHPAIVSKETFTAARDMKQQKSPAKRKSSNLLAHKIYCGRCGAHMGIPDSAAKNPKYVCRTNLYYGSGCSMEHISKEMVNEAVFDEIQKMTGLSGDHQKSSPDGKELSQDMVDLFVEKVIVYDGTHIEVVPFEKDMISN